MKKLMMIAVMALFCSTAQAIEFTASYDNYATPNVSNNYDDGKGFTIGMKHPIWKDIKGRLDVSHISDIDFPTASDPKGSFGELRGYGFTYNLIYDLKYDENLMFFLYGGIGPTWWQFRENPLLQDSHITVKTDPSLVMKAGIGLDYKLNNDWNVVLSAGWLESNIHKTAKGEDGMDHNILDADNNIGLQYFTWTAGIRKKF